jgi:hypothetical protein
MAKMRIKRVNEDDFKRIRLWNRLRSMTTLKRDYYPEIGFIVDDVCAGFIVQTDSLICFLDGFASNPHSDKAVRDQALDLLSDTLVNFAHQRGYKLIMAYTRHPSIKKRCRKYGFAYKGEDGLYSREI